MKLNHRRTFLEQRRKAIDRLGDLSEVMRGTLLERMTQCNKRGCKCMRGQRHGPAYYVTVTYPKGKTRQIYVSKERKAVAEAWIANYGRVWRALEEISRINLELLRLKEDGPTVRPRGSRKGMKEETIS